MPRWRLAPGERDRSRLSRQATPGTWLQRHDTEVRPLHQYRSRDAQPLRGGRRPPAVPLHREHKKDKEGTIAALENYVRAYPKSRDAGKAELLLARAITRRRSAAPRPQPATPSSPSPPAPSTYASPPRSAMSSTSSGASTGLPLLAAEG